MSTCDQCRDCPPKGKSVPCKKYEGLSIIVGSTCWNAWGSHGQPMSSPMGTKCFTPRDPIPVDDGTTCQGCESAGKSDDVDNKGRVRCGKISCFYSQQEDGVWRERCTDYRYAPHACPTCDARHATAAEATACCVTKSTMYVKSEPPVPVDGRGCKRCINQACTFAESTSLSENAGADCSVFVPKPAPQPDRPPAPAGFHHTEDKKRPWKNGEWVISELFEHRGTARLMGDDGPVGDPRWIIAKDAEADAELPDGQCCGKCKIYDDASSECPRSCGTKADTTRPHWGQDCHRFEPKATPTLCNTCEHAPPGMGPDPDQWGHGANCDKTGLRFVTSDSGVKGGSCTRYKPRPPAPAFPPLPDADKLDRLGIRGYELTGECRAPVEGTDGWLFPDTSGDICTFGMPENPVYDGNRHILRKKTTPIDPPMPAKMPDGYVYVETREPVFGEDVYLSYKYFDLAIDIPFNHPEYGRRRHIVAPIEPETPAPYVPVDGQCCGACAGWTKTSKYTDYWRGCCAHESHSAFTADNAGSQCPDFTAKPTTPEEPKAKDEIPCLTCKHRPVVNAGYWHGSTMCSIGLMVRRGSPPHFVHQCTEYKTAAPTVQESGKTCGDCRSISKAGSEREPYYVCGNHRVPLQGKIPRDKPACEHFTPKTTPVKPKRWRCNKCQSEYQTHAEALACHARHIADYKPTRGDHYFDAITATTAAMNSLLPTAVEATAAFGTLSAAIGGTTGKDASIMELTREEKYPLYDYTPRPTCTACTGRGFTKPKCRVFDPNADRPDAKYTYRFCKGCGVAHRMQYAADSPQPTKSESANRVNRIAMFLAKRLGLFALWAIKNPVHAGAYYYVGKYAIKNGMVTDAAMWALTLLRLA